MGLKWLGNPIKAVTTFPITFVAHMKILFIIKLKILVHIKWSYEGYAYLEVISISDIISLWIFH